MKHATIVGLVVALSLAFSATAAPALQRLTGWVEQDGRRQALGDEVREIHLKKNKPFSFIFEGDKDNIYVLAVAEDYRDLNEHVRRDTNNFSADRIDLTMFEGPMTAAIDTSAPEATYLIVNVKGAFQANQYTTQAWLDDPKEGGHSFQSFTRTSGDVYEARRLIDVMMVNKNLKSDMKIVPIQKYRPKRLAMILGVIPPGRSKVGDMFIFTVVFD